MITFLPGSVRSETTLVHRGHSVHTGPPIHQWHGPNDLESYHCVNVTSVNGSVIGANSGCCIRKLGWLSIQTHLQDLDLLPEQVLALGEILLGDGFDGHNVAGALQMKITDGNRVN